MHKITPFLWFNDQAEQAANFYVSVFRKNSKILGHIGARGTAYWNVRLLDRIFGFAEIRVHSRRPESRDAFAARLSRDLGKTVVATQDWESCVRGADIIVIGP